MGEDRTRDRPRDGLDRITTAEAAHKRLSTEAKAEALREMDREAREAFALQMARGF